MACIVHTPFTGIALWKLKGLLGALTVKRLPSDAFSITGALFLQNGLALKV
jgi:hypothetical protein